jgi:lipid II:glycine glycyltransferase (peptidoglycan interpeptide bridge formation enzyme)
MKTHGIRIADTWYDAPVAPKKYLRRTNYRSGTCPHAEHLAERIVNLPTHVNVSQDDARAIASLINEWARADLALPYHVRAANESAWEDFIRRQKPHSFLHSWKWGLLQEETGSRVFRLGAYKGGNLVAIALLIRTQARRGTFLLCPHGPLMAAGEDSAPIFNLLVEECTRLGRAEGCDFLRFCPLAEDSERNRALYRNAGFRDAPIHMHPELAWMLDITRSEDELLREMRKTTRYLVRKMEKDGVEIARSNDPADIEKFWPIYEATAARQHFTTFKKSDLRKEFELYAKDDQALFFFGSQRGSLVAAAIIIFYGGQAFYHHSGSASYDAGGANVSYLLQWRVIQEAKRRGCTLYNLWGIAPDDRPDHPWAGLSLFKKGFGGFAERYVHAQDKPLSAKYGLNYLVETARRIKRGF